VSDNAYHVHPTLLNLALPDGTWNKLESSRIYASYLGAGELHSTEEAALLRLMLLPLFELLLFILLRLHRFLPIFPQAMSPHFCF